MEKLLTIAVPTYNMEEYLDRCLSSLVVDGDRMALLEVLVVNDGSKDRSSEIAHGYASRYPGTFRVIDKQNGNYGSCINAALPEARGKYIKVLDADDFVEKESLVRMLDGLDTQDDADMVITDIRYVDGSGQTCDQLSFGLPGSERIAVEALDRTTICRLHMHAITYRTDVLKSIGYRQSEGISYTDLEWTYYPMEKVSSVRYSGFPLYVYNTSREGQTTSWKKHCSDMWMEMGIVEKMLARYHARNGYQDLPQSEYMKEKLLCYIRQIYSYFLLQYPHHLKQSDLRAFDKAVSLCPDLYSELSGTSVSVHRMGDVRYIREWRKHHSRVSPFFVLYDLQESAACIYRKLK